METAFGDPAKRIELARRLFDDGRAIPDGFASGAVLRSWQRSRQIGHSFKDKVLFNPVSRNARNLLEDRHHELLVHVEPELQRLTTLLRRGEWAVSFIDPSGDVVKTLRTSHPHFQGLISAFRPGVNLGELGAGTTGPSCALAERRTVVISGNEHFLSEAGEFTCTSSPIFDARGQIAGVINASRKYLGHPDGVPLAVSEIAHLIENRLVESIPGSICIAITLDLSEHITQSGILAFSSDGCLLGANRFARSLLGIDSGMPERFSELFGGSFAALVDRLHSGKDANPSLEAANGQILKARLHAAARQKLANHVQINSPAPDKSGNELLPPELEAELAKARKAFNCDLPVLINGETGTGKEVMARWLHANGPRASGPFVAIDCSSIPAGLIESELFGYEPGAFTGASRHGMAGKLQQASGGTLFLDEIGDMPLELQARLLRVVQERKVSRIGSSKELPLDFSLVSATHRDLPAMILHGEFREDLFYRINGYRLSMPALRTRSDFSRVVDRLLTEHPQPDGSATRISAGAETLLRHHPWPGNIRQLSQVLRLACALTPTGTIEPCHLPEDIVQTTTAEIEPAGSPLAIAESQVIRNSLAANLGNISATARALGISRATLYKKLREYRIRIRPDEH